MFETKHDENYKHLAQSIATAHAEGQPILVSLCKHVTNHNPLAFFAAGNEQRGTRTFLTEPSKELTLVGVGAVLTLETNQPDNFQFIEKKWTEWMKNTRIHGLDTIPGTGPTLLGGFSFDPLQKQSEEWTSFPAAKMTLPEFLLTNYKGSTYLTTHFLVYGHEDPDMLANHANETEAALFQSSGEMPLHKTTLTKEEIGDTDAWMQQVEKAKEDIRHQTYEKIVLARALRVTSEKPFLAEHILLRLQNEQPHSYIFALESGDDCFMGASPEQLVKREDDDILFTSLAGSMKRGETKQADEQLGQEFLRDSKNRYEHKLVVDMVADVAKNMCRHVNVPDAPVLYKMRDIQHLYTPITAKAAEESLLSIVEALHPTPAIGGAPQKQTVDHLRSSEALDRGWYAAPIGWLDHRQNGEFAVAIRSALVQEKQAFLFAGCGIVADSDPVIELKETAIKFRPMLSALGGDQA